MVTQPMGAKRVALSSQMLLPKQRTPAQLPLILVYLPVLLDISKLKVVLMLQTLAMLAQQCLVQHAIHAPTPLRAPQSHVMPTR